MCWGGHGWVFELSTRCPYCLLKNHPVSHLAHVLKPAAGAKQGVCHEPRIDHELTAKHYWCAGAYGPDIFLKPAGPSKQACWSGPRCLSQMGSSGRALPRCKASRLRKDTPGAWRLWWWCWVGGTGGLCLGPAAWGRPRPRPTSRPCTWAGRPVKRSGSCRSTSTTTQWWELVVLVGGCGGGGGGSCGVVVVVVDWGGLRLSSSGSTYGAI